MLFKFSYSSLAGLLLICTGFIPSSFGQLSDLHDILVAADLSIISKSHQSSTYTSMGDSHIKSPSLCPSRIVKLSEGVTQSHSAPLLLGGTRLVYLTKRIPECVKTVDATEEQEKRWERCVAGLKCRKGVHYCSNDAGDQFASCDKNDCK